MPVSDSSGINEYIKANRLAIKEKKSLEALGLNPNPAVLEELFPETAHASGVDLPVTEIPTDRIVGVVSPGRVSAFSASFLPLPEPNTEFGAKWIALCEANLSDTGIRDPIDCVEYLGSFYVKEGNKRVSVMRYFGAVRISARVRRLLPPRTGEPRVEAYYEFIDFYKQTGIYDVQFTAPGDYARLAAAVGKKPGEEWTERESKQLASVFCCFKEAFNSLVGGDRSLVAENALLLFLKVYTYPQLVEMSPQELKKALSAVWNDVRTTADPEALTVKAEAESGEKKGVIQKLISIVPKHLDIAFIYQGDTESSAWTRGHAEGAAHLEKALSGSVTVREYCHADTPEEAEALIARAVNDGAHLVFTTTPPLLDAALKAAVKYPKAVFYNCSACQPLSSVISYYCRTYEGKFITGAIAGALAENDLVGYIGSYPIMGVPASINAFALGVSMTNPRARILLEWSCTEIDCVKKLRAQGARVISNRDIPTPDLSYLSHDYYGTFVLDENESPVPVASPVWMWGRLYENIVSAALSGSTEKKDQAVNYLWGMDSGVIDVALSENVPEGVRALADLLMERLKKGELDVFGRKLYAQDGSLISDGERKLSWLEILKMDKLAASVQGHIPEYGELLPLSRPLVRSLGIYKEKLPPELDERL